MKYILPVAVFGILLLYSQVQFPSMELADRW